MCDLHPLAEFLRIHLRSQGPSSANRAFPSSVTDERENAIFARQRPHDQVEDSLAFPFFPKYNLMFRIFPAQRYNVLTEVKAELPSVRADIKLSFNVSAKSRARFVLREIRNEGEREGERGREGRKEGRKRVRAVVLSVRISVRALLSIFDAILAYGKASLPTERNNVRSKF